MSLTTIERQTGASPKHSVIWLHGLGADGHDFEPIIPELVARDWPALRFVFPNAPVRPVTINGGMPMRAWYDIKGMQIEDKQDEAGIRDSITALDALIAREVERGIPPERIVLAGFSQGGAIALAAAIGRTEPLAGVIALSTYLPQGAATLRAMRPEARAQPVFMAHGMHDPVVPYTAGKRSRDALRDVGFVVDWHAFPMAHQVCVEEIGALSEWMSRRFAS